MYVYVVSKATPRAESENELDFASRPCPTAVEPGLRNKREFCAKIRDFLSPSLFHRNVQPPDFYRDINSTCVRHNGRTYDLQITNLTLHRVSVYLAHVVPSVALADITYM